MKDYRVTLSVRNNRLLSLIEEKFGTQAEFSRETGVPYSQLSGHVTMRIKPINQSGWTDIAENIASSLGVYPSDIWPEHMQDVRLKTRTADLHLSADEVAAIAAPDVDNASLKKAIEHSRDGLSNRYSEFLDWLLDGNMNATFEEKGRFLDVSKERARQIEQKMYRTMKGKMEVSGIKEVKDVLTPH